MPPFVQQIDWEQLRIQKLYLIAREHNHKARGLIDLVDALQDYAVAAWGFTEEEVFGKKPKTDGTNA